MSHPAIIKLSQTGGPEMAPSDKQLFNDRTYLFTVVFECTQFLFYTNCIYAIHLTGSAQHSRVWYGVVEYGRWNIYTTRIQHCNWTENGVSLLIAALQLCPAHCLRSIVWSEAQFQCLSNSSFNGLCFSNALEKSMHSKVEKSTNVHARLTSVVTPYHDSTTMRSRL